MKCHNVIQEVQEQTIKAVNAGHFHRKQQDNDSTINKKETTSISKRITSKKGGIFTLVKKDDNKEEDEEEDDLPLSTYEEYLYENRVILLNVRGVDPVFGGDCVSEGRIGYV